MSGGERRHDDGAGSAQSLGGCCAGQARVAAGRAVEVDVSRRPGEHCAVHHEAYASRLEGAGGLEVFELEEDIAAFLC